jgi:TatA/E family protein of Tat protein translocase
MPFDIQPIHVLIVILIGFLIFGANKLPEMGRGLGKAISEFRRGTKEATEGFKEETNKARNSCVQCGTPNPAEAHFCASCGNKLPTK